MHTLTKTKWCHGLSLTFVIFKQLEQPLCDGCIRIFKYLLHKYYFSNWSNICVTNIFFTDIFFTNVFYTNIVSATGAAFVCRIYQNVQIFSIQIFIQQLEQQRQREEAEKQRDSRVRIDIDLDLDIDIDIDIDNQI